MKFSKHPVGTIINVDGCGKYEKVSAHHFRSLEQKNTFFTTKHLKTMQKQGTEINIVAAPWRVVVELLIMLQDEYGHRDSEGNLTTFDSVYKDAISRDEESKRIKERLDSRAVNYCIADVKQTAQSFSTHPTKTQAPQEQVLPVIRLKTWGINVEEWRKIPGYNWSVSNQGRVRNDNISQHITRPYQHNGKMYVELTDDQGRYVETSIAWIFRHTFPEMNKG
jgi:hypothetical protein